MKWIVADEHSHNSLGLIESRDKPKDAIAPWPVSMNESLIDVCEVIFRHEYVPKMNRNMLVGVRVQVNPHLVHTKIQRLSAEAKAKFVKEFQSMGVKNVVVNDSGKVKIVQVDSHVTPQNFVGDAPPHAEPGDEHLLTHDGKNFAMDVKAKFDQKEKARTLAEEWNGQSPIQRIKASLRRR